MLSICGSYATSHGLVFNAAKTQLICFRLRPTSSPLPIIHFNEMELQFVDQVTHLGHILHYDLNDKHDIIRATKDLLRKANCVLYKFSAADPFLKSFLLKSFCLSLYGSCLWSLSSPSINIMEIALNKLLRRIWNLPYNSHSGIVHCSARISTIRNILYDRFCSLFSRSMSSQSPLLKSIFAHAALLAYSYTGYNSIYGFNHYRHFSDSEERSASIIRRLRSFYGLYSPCEQIISFVSCS